MKKIIALMTLVFSINMNAQNIITIAGNGTAGYSGNGSAAISAKLNLPYSVAFDGAGNMYIADANNFSIRKVNKSTGIITTVAGNGTSGYSGDGGQATNAQLNYPSCVAFDATDNMYIADNFNHCIRKINTSGIISTFAGNGTAGFSGDGGVATSAKLNYPYGLTVANNLGVMYIADASNNRIREVGLSTNIIKTTAGNGTAGFNGDGAAGTTELSYPVGVSFDIEKVEKFPYLGTYYNMYIGNRMPFTDIEATGANNGVLNGKFVVDYGTDTSVVDLFGFPGYALYRANDQQYSLTFKNGSLSSGPYKQFCYHQDLSNITANGIREAGIIGTDILSKLIITFDYQYSRLYIVWDATTQCKPETLANKGFVPVSTKGYFSNDKKDLILKDKNNNPTVPIVIGDEKNTARALAQIDPGYDDRCHLDNNFDTYYTHIININKLYFDLLKKNGITITITITIDRKNYYTLNNRSSAPDTIYKCSFSKRYIFNVIGTNGESVIPYGTDECNVFLKVNAPGGESAGGITTLPFPAAQFGGSFLLDCNKVTFDPFRAFIWFQTNRLFKK